ncbi:hypothetical protein [Azospirillum thermophilum]|uniref:Uncharacterized protein n=1 Tax=Azospirillum thermophilum TaxID=2202148 RepID=A0A2S2CRC4_9PROT|nr:hypothetical protein [Azospirillum thermophilum]AWK86847.1 hypothetical protein DEW08_11945 [Azospirillum thermophilum]
MVNVLNLPYSLNYMHAGQVIALNGTPVVTAAPPADQTPADTYTFPLNASGSTYFPTYLVNQQAPAGVTNDSVVPLPWTVTPQNTSGPTISGAVSNLWQHMPFTYAQLLYQTLPTCRPADLPT